MLFPRWAFAAIIRHCVLDTDWHKANTLLDTVPCLSLTQKCLRKTYMHVSGTTILYGWSGLGSIPPTLLLGVFAGQNTAFKLGGIVFRIDTKKTTSRRP